VRLFGRQRKKPSEATISRQQAERDLEKVRGETPAYRALGRAVHQVVFEENNLGRNLTEAFRGNR
jgi:hypothetical protein